MPCLAAPGEFASSDSKVVIYDCAGVGAVIGHQGAGSPPGTVTDWIGADSLAERLSRRRR